MIARLARTSLVAALLAAPVVNAQWTLETISVGAAPGPGVAFSESTGRAYIPLLREDALAVLHADHTTSKVALPVKAFAVAIDQAAARIGVASLTGNAVHVLDEASGRLRSVSVGVMPSHIRANPVNGRFYVANWGGLEARGSLSIVDGATMSVRTTPLGAAAVELGIDTRTGRAYVTYEGMPGASGIAMLDAEGNLLARQALSARPYALHVDSQSGRVYVGSGSNGSARVQVLDAASLEPLRAVEWQKENAYAVRMAFDAERGRLYFGAGGEPRLHSVDPDGNGLRTWDLALGTFENNGPRANGIHGLAIEPGSGLVFIASPSGRQVSAFDPATGNLERITIPGAVGFNNVVLSPDARRVVIPDAEAEDDITVLKRAATPVHGIARDLLKLPALRREDAR